MRKCAESETDPVELRRMVNALAAAAERVLLVHAPDIPGTERCARCLNQLQACTTRQAITGALLHYGYGHRIRPLDA